MGISRAAWQDLMLYLVVFTILWALFYLVLDFQFASDDHFAMVAFYIFLRFAVFSIAT